jgi:hypothetical protein
MDRHYVVPFELVSKPGWFWESDLFKGIVMYALVEFKGKQYRAEKGALLKVDKIAAEPGSSLNIDSVLLVSGDTVTLGAPYVKGA